MGEPSFSALPSGQRDWRALVDALSRTDDRVERHFLEMKSDVDLTQAVGRAKVAKFVLGAANRDPDRAAPYFSGSAVMVLGVAKDAVTGISGFEAHELERAVDSFTGTPGPGWDYVRIPVSSDRDVIAVIVAPPECRLWPCLKDGTGLVNGTIYLRADGETRPARGSEIQAMLARVQQTAAGPADFAVSVLGPAYSVAADDEVLNEFLSHHTARLMGVYRHHQATARASGIVAGVAALTAPEWMTNFAASQLQPERRSYDEYMRQIDDWKADVGQSWPTVLDHIAAYASRDTCVRIRNRSNIFAENLLVEVHLDGPVETIEAVDRKHRNLARLLPSPPTDWGPKPVQIQMPGYQWTRPAASYPLGPPTSRRGISFDNGGSTTLRLELPELRPQTTHDSSSGQVALIVRDADCTEISGRWRITTRGHHRVYEDEITVPVKTINASDALRAALLPSDSKDSEGEN